MNRKITVFDTTLRDGEQSPGCSMNTAEKLEVARQLSLLNVDVIEAGFAASSASDADAIRQICSLVKNCTIASLARAIPSDIDAAWDSLKDAVSPRIHLFIAVSDLHLSQKLHITREECLSKIEQSVSYACSKCKDVEFSAEDATRADRSFLCNALSTAIRAGATTINIPDTVGYTTPDEFYDLITYCCSHVEGIDRVALSVHCHNDLGMAVANSLAGIRAGASQVECTVNGIGERAGNAALEEIVMALKVRSDIYDCSTDINIRRIKRASKTVYDITGQTPSLTKPIVGTNAFSHEAGIHTHGILSDTATYEIMNPEDLGITKTKLVLGKHSGKHAVAERLTEMGYLFTEEELETCYKRMMELSDKKKYISDSDLEAIILNKRRREGKFSLVSFDVHTNKFTSSTCVIKLKHGDTVIEEVSLGQGPINAAYNAIDKITGNLCEEMKSYQIHSISDGNDALGEVTVKLKRGDDYVTGRGLSTDIIESSILAYINGINKLAEMV